MMRDTTKVRTLLREEDRHAASLMGWPVVVIAFAALAVVLPFLVLGNPSGHDFEFHMNSWMDVLAQWKQGVIFPAWAGLAHYGYGEPRFIFYPPVSWTMGGILGGLLPWRIVPAAYIWVALTFSGCSMFLLSRIWLGRNDSIFAAAFYVANPYYLVIVFWRSAFAELLAGALLPLVALFLWRANEGRRAFVPLALVVCAAWLTDVPAAVMLTYSLGLIAVALSITGRSPRVAFVGTLAVALGAALAAFYLLPAIWEQKWINIGQVLAPGVRPVDNFLFTNIGDPDHDRFNLLVSLIAFAEIVGLGGSVILSRKRVRFDVGSQIALWGFGCASIMFPFTLLAWKYFPELKFVQLPWRWLLCLNAAVALLLTNAWRRWTARILICAVFLAVLIFVGLRVQPPWWDQAEDISGMVEGQRSGRGYEGTDEYVPSATDGYDISRSAPLVTGDPGSRVQVNIQGWQAESKRFTVTASIPSKIYLRLFNYPAWRVEINGAATPIETRQVTGQMVIPVQAGMNRVEVTFTRTWDRTAGMLISLLAGIILLAGTLCKWRARNSGVVA